MPVLAFSLARSGSPGCTATPHGAVSSGAAKAAGVGVMVETKGIALHLAGQKIRIKGRNLNAEARQNVRLFEGITRHRIPWI